MSNLQFLTGLVRKVHYRLDHVLDDLLTLSVNSQENQASGSTSVSKMDSKTQKGSTRLLAQSLRNSFKKLQPKRELGKDDESASFASEVSHSPGLPNMDTNGKSGTAQLNGSKDVPVTPILLDSKDHAVNNEPAGGLLDFLGRIRSDSQRKRDSAASQSHGKVRSSSRPRANRSRRVVQVDEAEKLNLMARLKAVMHSIEQTLHLTDKDLETHLEDNDFVIEKAAMDLLERCIEYCKYLM